MSDKKRIVVCADGTWNDPEDENPTNVMRLARAIAPIASDEVKQVVFYDWGVGTYYDKIEGGAFGVGMAKNVQDGYRFIVQNFNPGDEIFLFGFSRGAYTVRCLAGMLNSCGILRRENADQIDEAFKLYKGRVKPGDPEAEAWRQQLSHSPERGMVKYIGVWDTVGALGVPTRALAFANEEDLFFDQELGSNVEVARHAISIDERRGDFRPTHWTEKDGPDIREVWFAGVHSDVGGGYAPDENGKLLSEIPLKWISSQAGIQGLVLEDHLLSPEQISSQAKQHNSRKRFYKVLKKLIREIPKGAVMHSSVKERFESSEAEYNPENLREWLEAYGGWGDLEP